MKPAGSHIVAEFIGCSKKLLLSNQEALSRVLRAGIKKAGLHMVSLDSHQFYPAGVSVVAIISESHIAIHTYPEARHASIDIFTCSSPEKGAALLRFLKKEFAPKTMRTVHILRGSPLEINYQNWITDASAEGFEVRYHVEKELHNSSSQYQKIDVIKNENFGRMLFLDNELQIADSDGHLYNEQMVAPAVKAKKHLESALILGGGDGGVLYELLKYRPGRVTMVEIDQKVIEVSRKFFPHFHHYAFDDPRAEVIINDAHEFLDQDRAFDAVFYDLTMHPESFIRLPREEYLEELFAKISKRLNKKGVLSAQCCLEFDTETIKIVRRILRKYFSHILFEPIFIPSYCANWVFVSARSKR